MLEKQYSIKDLGRIYPWQNQAWQNLLNRKNSGQLPHAILVKGIEGVGKFHFAKCFATQLLCKNPSSHACGRCVACELLQANNHPDLIVIQPEEENKAVKIEQIRDVVAELNNTSQQGGYKIVIIDHAELLNLAASNALLKTLEEPPSNVVMMLVSDKDAALISTIRSRCQIVTIKTPTYFQAQEWLKQQSLSVGSKLVLALAENAPLKALALINDNDFVKRNDFFKNLCALQNNQINSVQMAEKCLDCDLKTLLKTFMFIVTDLIKIKLNCFENIVNHDQIELLNKMAKKSNLKTVFGYYLKLLDTNKSMSKNIILNQQLTVENLTITLIELFTNNLC